MTLLAECPAIEPPRALDDPDSLHFVGNWTIVKVAPQQEQVVADLLLRSGIQSCHLTYVRAKRYACRHTVQQRIPVFPRYLPVCCHDDDELGELESLRSFFVSLFSGAPIRFVDAEWRVAERRQERFKRQLNGLYRSEKNGTLTPYMHPVTGQLCRITEGPYRGVECRVADDGRKLFIVTLEGIRGAAAVDIEIEPERLEILDDPS